MKKINSKKNKFIRLKNKKEPVYKTPGFMKNIGICQISESGIFMHTGNLFTKVYEKNLGDAEQLLKEQRLIRQLDITYSYLSFTSFPDKLYMQIVISAESFEKAQEQFEILEVELKGIAQLKTMLLEQRLRLVFQGIMRNFTEGKAVGEETVYSLGEVETWRQYAILDFVEDRKDSFNTSKGYFAFLSIYGYPDVSNNVQKESLYSMFKTVPGVLGMQSTFEPITDFAIVQFIQEKYIGYEGVFPKMKRENPELYAIVAQPVEVNNRNFFCGNSVFLVYAETIEALENTVKDFTKKAIEKNCKVQNLCGVQKKLIWDFFFLQCGQKKASRFLPVSRMALLNPVQYMAGEIAEEQEAEKVDMEEMRKLFFS